MSLRRAAVFFPILVVLAGFSGIPLAAEFRAGEGRERIEGTVDDDVYVVAEEVLVSGEVTGDMLAAAQTVILEGSTGGSLFAGAETVNIGGQVGNSARVGAREVSVTGSITGDLLAGAQSVVIEQDGSVGRDLVVGSQNLEIAGAVEGNVLGSNQTTTISGTIRGDVRVEAENVILTEGAVVEGDLIYTSRNRADIDSGARVGGEVERRTPAVAEEGNPVVNLIVAFVRGVLGAMVLGLVIMWLAPGLLPALARTIRTAPLPSFGTGFGGMIAIPILAVFLLVVAVILGTGVAIPFLLVAGAGFMLALAKVTVGFLIGAWAMNREDPQFDLPFRKGVLALLLGVTGLTLVSFVPVLGGLVSFFVALLALGAGIVALFRWRRQRPPAAPAQAEPARAQGT